MCLKPGRSNPLLFNTQNKHIPIKSYYNKQYKIKPTLESCKMYYSFYLKPGKSNPLLFNTNI